MHFPRLAVLAPFALSALLLSAAGHSSAQAAGHSDLWLHVAVDNRDRDEAKVRVTLPLALVEGVIPFLEGNRVGKGHLRVSDVDDLDLRQAWEAARSAREGRFVEVPTKGAGTLHVARQDGQLVLRARDDDSEVHVRMPWKVAEQLAAAGGDGTVDLDLRVLVRALRDFGPGELVTAEAEDASIRLWIDKESGDDD
jgi:hypothetical protein